jgi:phosphopantothenoylcysteine decarboxylase/phosphopantothenate--cysteine ligase
MLSGKKILLGITGGIAAYKSAHIVREFIKAGADVKCIQTPASKDFITPLTLSTLSKNEVYSEFTTDEENPRWNDHVSLGLWADIFIIAPATANTLAKMCQGICDNLLMATYLSAKCPVYFAPAMDLDMFKHSSTQLNVNTLISFGNKLIPSGYGELASGLSGEGRMAEPPEIKSQIINDLNSQLPLHLRKVLITAGPTYEAIDPVRFIGNRSSGKMGCELALSMANRGAEVTLILGPSSLSPEHSNLKITRVESAEEMYNECFIHFNSCDIFIGSAAVSDYTPNKTSSKKIKKENRVPQINLVKTKDIISSLAKNKDKQFMVGFALETDDEIKNATLKLHNKNLDLIILNSLKDEGAGFETDTNKISVISKDNNICHYELKSKKDVAEDITNTILNEIKF